MIRSRTPARGAWAAALLVLAAGFAALGVWQIERREWKHALMEAVETRIHRAPVPAPGPAEWPRISAQDHEYTRVRLAGRYAQGGDTLVRAVTDLGAGYWVLTPLRTERFTVLINRGFVPQGAEPTAPPTAAATVTGLLRITEPGGGFLRSNDPARGRWFSRDVQAIAHAQGLGSIAPYFIDAAATPGAEGWPMGGLTVVRFTDNHLSYALTWFALALLSLAACVWLLRNPRIGSRNPL